MCGKGRFGWDILGSVTGIIAQVREMLDSEEKDETKLTQQLQTLKEKHEILSKIDLEILDSLTDEQEIVNEITQADAFQEGVDLTVTQIQSALKCLNITTNPQHVIPEPQRSPRQLQAGPNVSSPVQENPASSDHLLLIHKTKRSADIKRLTQSQAT